MALPRENRLSLRLHKDDFSKGKKFFSKHFTVVTSASSQLTFAILVSKKTAKKATERNKIRRLSSTAIQNLLYQFPRANYLVIPKSTILSTPFLEIINDLSSLFPKIHNS